MTTNAQWLGAVDPARREAFERALNVAGAGNTLLQTMIQRTIQQLQIRELGAFAVLPRRPGSGNAEYINRRTPGATGGSWVADTDAVPEETGTYAQAAFSYKTLVSRGKITRKLQATGRSYGDILAGEMTAKTGDFSETMEQALIVGDSNASANQIDGLLTLTQATASQVVAQTTVVGGDALTLEKLDETIDAVKGSAARSDLVILASFKGRRALNGALQAQQQFNDMVEIAAGFRVRTYDGIPIVTTTEMPDDLTWNGTTNTAFSGGPTTSIIVVNTRHTYLSELTPLTVLPLAKSDSQFDQFDLYWDGALVTANPFGTAILGGILP
tara:strand:- start:880 stop:1863 length:984 start_codon:yes stop_codon:yes gene_type:complete